jgi:hypothetical protein
MEFIKIHELKTKDNEEYANHYNQFKNFLLESKKKFYSEIYIPTNKHDQTVNNIYNIMKQDFIKE